MVGKGDSLAHSLRSKLASGLDNLLAKNSGNQKGKNVMDENVEFDRLIIRSVHR